MDKLLFHLENLANLDGIASLESQVFQYMKTHLTPFADEIISDGLGSIFGVKKSKNPHAKRVLLAGHMDEVGFMVKGINDVGSLSIYPVGGWWSQTLMSQRVRVTTQDGRVYKGTIGSIPPHLLTEAKRNAVVDIADLLVDVGATSKQEVLELGINLGDMVVLDGEFVYLNEHRILSKALDNRYGCAMALAMLEAFKDVELPFDLIAGATVQEEVGLRGAQTAASLTQPDIAIVYDCSPANDAGADKDVLGKLGAGVLLRFVDASMLPNRCMIERLKHTAIQHELPYQYYLSLGGTDAGAIHKANIGVPTLTMCICARNIHTSSSICDVNDLKAAYHASLHFIGELNENAISDMIKCNQ
jgi:glutamyl aminopeptidase